MTKTKALHDFFSSFGVDAYPNTSVPDDATYPYIAYDVQTSSYSGLPVSLSASLFYYTSSEAVPNAKADAIGKKIGEEGVLIDCDDGKIWITKGSPFCVNQTGQDNNLKLRYMNFTVKYFTF